MSLKGVLSTSKPFSDTNNRNCICIVSAANKVIRRKLVDFLGVSAARKNTLFHETSLVKTTPQAPPPDSNENT
jgi:hypothetical protein